MSPSFNRIAVKHREVISDINQTYLARFSVLIPELIEYGLVFPYLFNGLLSLRSLHLGVIRQPQQEFYRHHSAQLQNHALEMIHGVELDSF